jgi:alpha-L-fucosidase 2
LKDGEKALSSLYELFTGNTEENLFDLHPPHIFQIDGNLGATAGISELLIQSHLGTPDKRIVELLPALPPEWKNGSITGLRARGNFTFDLIWKDGHLREVTVLSADCNTLLLKLPKAEPIPSSDVSITVDNGILSYSFQKGERISLRFYH